MRTKQVPGTYFSKISWEPNSGIHFKYHELYLQIEWKPCDYAAEEQSKSRNLECQESIIFSLWSGDWSEEIFIAPPDSYVRASPVKEAFLQFNLLWLCWRPQPQPAKWNCFSQFLAIAERQFIFLELTHVLRVWNLKDGIGYGSTEGENPEILQSQKLENQLWIFEQHISSIMSYLISFQDERKTMAKRKLWRLIFLSV